MPIVTPSQGRRVAADLMTPNPVTVDVDDRLARVKSRLDEHPFHHLLVVEDGVLVGIISEREMLKALSPHLGTMSETSRDTATLRRPVHQVMVRRPVAVTPDTGTMAVVKAFNTYGVSCVPVVDANNRPVGVITWRDLLRAVDTVLLGDA